MMKKLLKCLAMMTAAILLTLSSCTMPPDQPLNNHTVETTLPPTIEETQPVKPEETVVEFDVNLGGNSSVKEIIMNPFTAPATLQINQTKDGETVVLENLTFSDSAFGGYYLRHPMPHGVDEILYWNAKVSPDGTELLFQYIVFYFDRDGKKVFKKDVSDFFDLDLTAENLILAENLSFRNIQSKLNSLLLSEGYAWDVFVLIENRGDGIVYSTPDNMIETSEAKYTLEDFKK